MNIVYLNGQYIPQEKAKISIMDRGFLFGDGIYEVIPVYDGLLFGFEEHMQRLKKSLTAVHIPPPLTEKQWKQICKELIKLNDKTVGEHTIYLQITRGPDETRQHGIPKNINPTIVAFCTKSKHVEKEVAAAGYSAITLEDTRHKNCHIKAITLLPNILLHEEAKQAGAYDAILIRDGEAIEGTSSNLFIVKSNIIMTPPLSENILSGITRNLILDIAKQNKIAYQESIINLNMLKNADEIWLSGSSKEIRPVIKLDYHPVGTGKVGPMWQQMINHFEDTINKLKLKKSNTNND